MEGAPPLNRLFGGFVCGRFVSGAGYCQVVLWQRLCQDILLLGVAALGIRQQAELLAKILVIITTLETQLAWLYIYFRRWKPVFSKSSVHCNMHRS